MVRILERMSVVIIMHGLPHHHQSSMRTQLFPYNDAGEILNEYWFEEELVCEEELCFYTPQMKVITLIVTNHC